MALAALALAWMPWSPRSARAEAPAPDAAATTPATALTLAAALARAAEHAPRVRASLHAVKGAEARRVGAGVLFPANPRLSLDARQPIEQAQGTHTGWAATLELPMEVGGAPAARVREAERLGDVARVDLQVERVTARAAAWAAYALASVSELRRAETDALVAIAERIAAASERREQAGATGDIERSLAATELSEFRAAAEEARTRREIHLSELRTLLDLPADEALELTTPLEDPGAVPDEAPLVAHALATRPELEATRRRVRLLEATDERLARETFPRVGPFVGVDMSPSSVAYAMLGVAVELPVAQRNQGPRAVAQASRAGELDRLGVEARAIAREVAATRAAYRARHEQLRILTEQALPSVERTLELVQVGWMSGRFDLFRVTSAARDVARVRSLRLDALETAWLQRIALARAAGNIEP